MIKIIDISHHQVPSNLNYDSIASNVTGVIIRAAYGTIFDKYVKTHFDELTARGVPLGIYQFLVEFRSAAGQVETLGEVFSNLGVTDIDQSFPLGMWADVELEDGAPILTKATVDSYMSLAEARFGTFGIYSSRNYWDQIMKTNAYKTRKLWVAHYGAAVPYLPVTGGWTKWWMWQYITTYLIDGCAGGFDNSFFWGDEGDFNDWVGEDILMPVPEPDPLYQVEVVNCVALNVRSTPSSASNSNIVDTVYNGDILDVYDVSGSWLSIDTGWIHSAYTQRVEDVVVVPEPELSYEEKTDILWDAHPELH